MEDGDEYPFLPTIAGDDGQTGIHRRGPGDADRSEASEVFAEERGAHEGEEFGYVLSGSIQIHVGPKIYKAKKGESFYFTPHASHYITANGKTGAKFIWVSTPPSF